jgi:hypothetical protein
VVILEGIVNRISGALAKIETRIEKPLARSDDEARNDSEELPSNRKSESAALLY